MARREKKGGCGMSCLKEKRFLFWKYKTVEHDFIVWAISKFMSCSHHFQVHWARKNCDRRETESFFENDRLIKMGFNQSDLNKVTDSKWFYPKQEEK